MTLKKRVVQPASLLLSQLQWFIALRWIAGGTVVVFALADWLWLGWYSHGAAMLGTGVAILFYNAWMYLAVRGPGRPVSLLVVAAAQILLDLAALTLLTMWTGGVASPLMGFYVFHMIFASLMLPRRMTYAGVAVAIVLFLASVALGHGVGDWHRNQWLQLAGWVASLLLAVYLANHVTRALRRQRRKLIRQNRHIRLMSRKLRSHQQVLISQEKMAALGHMAAGITHEVTNPLASMDTLLQLLQRRPEKINPESLQKLREQVARVNEIVRQMTAFAHPGEGNWQVAQVNDVIVPALDMLRYDKRMERVQVKLELDPAAGSARMMTQAIQQVIINLVVNALDAMANTPAPQLTIRSRRSGQWCVIQVSDNGPGVRPDNVSRVFEPFFTTKPVGQGTGIGLSISYTLVTKHGGKIELQSKPGAGATFEVRLPALAETPVPPGTLQA